LTKSLSRDQSGNKAVLESALAGIKIGQDNIKKKGKSSLRTAEII
jgi:hypothetical protein